MARKKPAAPRRAPDPVEAARAQFIEGVGNEISDIWGRVSNLAGRIFAALYLEGRPMDMDEIAAVVGRSKSNVLVNLRTLVGLGLAAKTWSPDSRRDLYEVGPDYGNLILRAFFRRLGANLVNNGRTIEAATQLLDQAGGDADPAALAAMRERVATAARFYQTTQAIYDQFTRSIGFDVDFVAVIEKAMTPLASAPRRRRPKGGDR